MKLCEDCRWAHHWHIGEIAVDWMCRHPSAAMGPVDKRVINETSGTALPCDMNRSFGECGPEAQFWQAKGGFV